MVEEEDEEVLEVETEDLEIEEEEVEEEVEEIEASMNEVSEIEEVLVTEEDEEGEVEEEVAGEDSVEGLVTGIIGLEIEIKTRALEIVKGNKISIKASKIQTNSEVQSLQESTVEITYKINSNNFRIWLKTCKVKFLQVCSQPTISHILQVTHNQPSRKRLDFQKSKSLQVPKSARSAK